MNLNTLAQYPRFRVRLFSTKHESGSCVRRLMSEFPLPPLAALRAFEAAARRGRFSSAAEELHVSQSAVSHHVRHLEEYLHVRLFERAGVGMKLTEAGARFFAEIYPALERIRRATGEFRAQGARRRVTLTTLPSVVNTWLIPTGPRSSSAAPISTYSCSLQRGSLTWNGNRWTLRCVLVTTAIPGW